MSDVHEGVTTEDFYRAFSRVPETYSRPLYSVVNPEYSIGHYGRSIIGPNLLDALNRAREVRKSALSYRKFDVGAAMMALQLGGLSQARFLTGVNIKPSKDSHINGHAEQMTLQAIEDRHLNAISIVAVVADTQPDQQSGKHAHTLHPCGICRGIMADHPLIDPDLTLIATALPNLQTIELSTINGLNAYHRDEDSDDSGVELIELPEMKMLTPFDPGDATEIILSDSPQQQDEDRVWTEKVELRLIEWRRQRGLL